MRTYGTQVCVEGSQGNLPIKLTSRNGHRLLKRQPWSYIHVPQSSSIFHADFEMRPSETTLMRLLRQHAVVCILA